MKELTKEHVEFWMDIQKERHLIDILQNIEDQLIGEILGVISAPTVDKVGYITGVRDAFRQLAFRKLTPQVSDLDNDENTLPYDIELKQHGNRTN
jgi:hypothetical protein